MKRLWTDEEKRLICFQTTAPGVSVAQAARRYAVTANQIFKWRCDPRFELDPASALPPSEETRFLPVESVAQTRSAPAPPVAANHIEIELASDRVRPQREQDRNFRGKGGARPAIVKIMRSGRNPTCWAIWASLFQKGGLRRDFPISLQVQATRTFTA